jgi:hypothetical protein
VKSYLCSRTALYVLLQNPPEIQANLDEKKLGKHPKALYLNGSEVGHVAPEALGENKQKQSWEEILRHADVKEGETVWSDWK